jgi:hypothetical protein
VKRLELLEGASVTLISLDTGNGNVILGTALVTKHFLDLGLEGLHKVFFLGVLRGSATTRPCQAHEPPAAPRQEVPYGVCAPGIGLPQWITHLDGHACILLDGLFHVPIVALDVDLCGPMLDTRAVRNAQATIQAHLEELLRDPRRGVRTKDTVSAL